MISTAANDRTGLAARDLPEDLLELHPLRVVPGTDEIRVHYCPGCPHGPRTRGARRMTERERLQKAIRDLHGREGTYLRSEAIREEYCGQVVWEGEVEIFAVDHPTASLAYAWAHETDKGGIRYVAVLGLPPVKSARDAVRAAILAQQGIDPAKR